MIHHPQQYLKETNREWDIFQYGYQFSMKDKIYVSTIKNKDIITECLKDNERTIQYNENLAGDIKNEYQVSSLEAIEYVKDELKWHMSNILHKQISNLDMNGKFGVDLWVNYQEQYEFNPSHNHSGKFSFVIYADIPEEVRQEHKQSNGNSPSRGLIQFSSELTNDKLYFNPSEDTILIFESSHVHQVYPFYSDNTRISIAGNIHGYE